MKTLRTAAFLLLLAAVMQAEPIQLLIIVGGHEFEEKSFYSLFEGMEGISAQIASQPAANDLYNSREIKKIDVILFYDMVQEISDAQKTAFLSLLEKGKGLVFLHHSLASYQGWDEFTRIRGGKYVLPESLPENERSAASTYRHDVRFRVQIVDANHPVTQGVSEFELYDEVYGNLLILEEVTPLLRTPHPESSPVIGWTNKFGASKIVCLQPGHGPHAYENPQFRRLVRNAVRWAAAAEK